MANLQLNSRKIIFLLTAILIATVAFPVYYENLNTGEVVEVYPIPLVNQADLQGDKSLRSIVPEAVDHVKVFKIPVMTEELGVFTDIRNSAEVSNLGLDKKYLRVVNEQGQVIYSYIFSPNDLDTKGVLKDSNSMSDKSEKLLMDSSIIAPLKVDGLSISVVDDEVKKFEVVAVDDFNRAKKEELMAIASSEDSATSILLADEKSVGLVLDQKTGSPLVLVFDARYGETSSMSKPGTEPDDEDKKVKCHRQFVKEKDACLDAQYIAFKKCNKEYNSCWGLFSRCEDIHEECHNKASDVNSNCFCDLEDRMIKCLSPEYVLPRHGYHVCGPCEKGEMDCGIKDVSGMKIRGCCLSGQECIPGGTVSSGLCRLPK